MHAYYFSGEWYAQTMVVIWYRPLRWAAFCWLKCALQKTIILNHPNYSVAWSDLHSPCVAVDTMGGCTLLSPTDMEVLGQLLWRNGTPPVGGKVSVQWITFQLLFTLASPLLASRGVRKKALLLAEVWNKMNFNRRGLRCKVLQVGWGRVCSWTAGMVKEDEL